MLHLEGAPAEMPCGLCQEPIHIGRPYHRNAGKSYHIRCWQRMDAIYHNDASRVGAGHQAEEAT